MKLEGEFTVAAPAAEVWDAIRDPGLMAACIPGCEAAEPVSDTSYRAVVGVRLGPIAARFNLVVDIVEEIAPRLLRSRARGEEGSRASMLSSDNVMTLEERADGTTRVDWRADVSLTGRLGKYGLGIMRKKAEALSEEFVQAFSARLETREARA